MGEAVSDAEAVEVFGEGFREADEVARRGHGFQSETLFKMGSLGRIRIPTGKLPQLLLQRALDEMLSIEIGPAAAAGKKEPQVSGPRIKAGI